jgi:hypothetical protein
MSGWPGSSRTGASTGFGGGFWPAGRSSGNRVFRGGGGTPFLLLLEDLVADAGVAELIGAFSGVSGQPEGHGQPETQRADDQHDERHLAGQGARPQVDRRQPMQQTVA